MVKQLNLTPREVASWKQLTEREVTQLSCPQCEALMINGVFCHETDCPNENSRYDLDSGAWIKQYKCFECGFLHDVETSCQEED
jgi:hypothetical protein